MELRFTHLTFSLIIGLVIVSPPASAQSQEPLELTASQTLEWHRDVQEFIARGNVVAKQGDTELHSEEMKAFYQEGQDGEEILLQKLIASGSVIIHSADGRAVGDQVVYDVERGKAILTGEGLSLTTEQTVVTAEERFEYDIESGKISGYGNSRAVQSTEKGKNIIEADVLSALFTKQEGKGRILKSMTAEGDVVITTPTEVIKGQRGTYNKAENIAILTGDVVIERGANILEGHRARVNLNKNISTLFGDNEENKRVRGIFYPNKD